MKISEIITDKYKLRIPPTVYYELLADVREVEEDQEPTTKNDLGVDCISRQVISDYVESHIQEINTGYGDLNRHTNSILRMIVDYIENMPSVTPQESRWISTSVRLPDTDDEVLCWYEYYHWSQEKVLPEYGIGCYLRETSSWFGEVAKGHKVRVIAWMPLPKVYRGVEE